MWNGINGKYAHSSENHEMISDVLVITIQNLRTIHKLLQEHKNFKYMTENIFDSYKKVEEIFKKYSHKVLHDNLGYNIRMEMYSMRMMSVHDLVDDGFLVLPEDTSKSSLGMFLMLN